MSIISIDSFLKQNFTDPDFSIIDYFKAIQAPENNRGDVEKEIKEYVASARKNKENESEEFVKFLENFKKCDYMILKTDSCNKFWRDKAISDHKNKVIDQEFKRKSSSVAMKRESKRIKKGSEIKESDTVLHRQLISTGTKIKTHAYDLYKDQVYNKLPVQAKNAISLGFNSVLDLSNDQHDNFSQKQLFTHKEWENLHDLYGSEIKYPSTPEDVKTQLKKVFKKANTDLVEAYKDCLEYQIKHAFTCKEIYFKVAAHFITILKDHPDYLEVNHKTFTEANYAVKVWAPVVESVFNHEKLEVQWGESVNTRSTAAKKLNQSSDGDAKAIGDKVDFRICYKDHDRLVDLLNGEMGKEQRCEAKYFQDHSKLARESKIIGDHFYSSTCLTRKIKKTIKVRGVHISATEGEMIECRLVDNGLYIFDKLGSLRIPSSELDLNRCRTLVNRLLELKRGCLALARSYRIMKEKEKDLEYNMDKMKNRGRSPFNDSDSDVPDEDNGYEAWVRGSWFPPSKGSKTIYDGKLPPFLLSPPPSVY